jgi:pimeloyl-ACP methyl ester carboxylesterase
MRQVLILHGWSDSSKSFRALAQVLRQHGYQAVPLWLGDYISKDDDVSIPDVAKRMEEVVAAQVAAGQLQVPFDMIVHSTGGLVARVWLTMFDAARPSRWLERLVMLAPANHGSRLASLGKSMLGRLTKGLDNGLQTGTQMLNALELGSPFQWQLAMTDVLHEGSVAPGGPTPYSSLGCLPFVITGIKGYSSLLRKPLNEDGADGTVRAASANLTSHGLTLDFTGAEVQASHWVRRGPLEAYAFRLLDDVDHSSIVQGGASVRALILQALGCPMDAAAYAAVQQAWSIANEALASEADPARHQFYQLNTFVVDDLGQPVADHFIEFYGSSTAKRDAALALFQSDVIEHVHVNRTNGACRTFYIDRTDMFTRFYAAQAAGHPKDVRLSVWANPPGPNITYFDTTNPAAGTGQYPVHVEDDPQGQHRWLRRHCTHFLKIIIPRRPKDRVFRMARFEA